MSTDSADLDEGLSSDVIDRFLDDDDDDESLLDDSASVTATAPSDPPGSIPEPDPVPDSPAAPPESDAAQASAPAEGAPAEAAPTETIPPVEAGQPFTFRVDGTEIALPGAQVFADHIRIPTAVWNEEVRPKWLANRNAWREKELGWQQQLTQAQTAKSDREYRADALTQKFMGLLDDENALLEFVGNFQQNAPKLRAEAGEAAALAQLASRQQEDQTRAEAERAEQLRPQLQRYLGSQVEALLAEEPFKILGANQDEAVKFVQRLWNRHGSELFYEDAQGQIQLRGDVLRDLVQEKVAGLQAIKDAVAAATKTARENAKAVAPTVVKSGPKTVAPRPPTKPGPKKRMTADEWEERLANLDLEADD